MKYVEANVPDGIRVHVWRDVTKEQYLTVCELIDVETREVVARGHSSCHPNDQPNRKIGRMIAVGRAVKQLEEGAEGSAKRFAHGMEKLSKALSA